MMNVGVYSCKDGKQLESQSIEAGILPEEFRPAILQQIVKWQLAKKRQGTHQAKTRSDVSGGGKKPFKQKGTGSARQGSTRSPLMEGGGITHGPTPRSYEYQLNRKFKLLGLKQAVLDSLQKDRLKIVNDLPDTGKTKDLAQALRKLNIETCVLVSDPGQGMLQRSAQNLSGVRCYPVAGINVFDLLKYKNVVVSSNGWLELVKRLKGEQHVPTH